MICNICKDKVATIRLKEIISDTVTELHLCQACFEAREQEGTDTGNVLPGKTLGSLEGQFKGKTESRTKQCHVCGVTEAQFHAKGRFGCSSCYEAFSLSLESVLTKIHGSTEHRGKRPRQAARNLDLKTELRQLQGDLQKAILSENYERAAKLRDRIKQFENT